jgi:hypothetical protein
MSTDIRAYNFRLWDIKFSDIKFEIPVHEPEGSSGRVLVETGLSFGIQDNDLFCTVVLSVKLIKGEKIEVSAENTTATLEITAAGRFELPEGHSFQDNDFENLTDDQVGSFSRVMEPPLIMKARGILIEAGLDASGVPLQLGAPVAMKD